MNDLLNQQFIEITNNQIAQNNPPETKATLARLMASGHSKADATKLIAQCVSIEIFEVMKSKSEFNLERFVKNLNNLPKLP